MLCFFGLKMENFPCEYYKERENCAVLCECFDLVANSVDAPSVGSIELFNIFINFIVNFIFFIFI